MSNHDLMKSLSITSPSRIVLLVIDGLGGLPHPKSGKTELETARTPNLDKLASAGTCGLSDPVGPGITPGSGAGHLALFGYDPLAFNIGRGVLEAAGIDFDMQPGDIASRGNFCTVDRAGAITDRRAGRISSEKAAELCGLLDGITIDNVKVMVRPVKEHRCVVIFRGEGLSAELSDSDPQQTGIAPKAVAALNSQASGTARIANHFLDKAKVILAEHHPANMLLLRGFSKRPAWPLMQEIYKLTPCAIAAYPMYRGLARLVGMDVLHTGITVDDEFQTLLRNYEKYDFIFLHVKGADSAGEDGDFDRKVAVIEQVDSSITNLLHLQPDVIVVTGDHSTPAVLKAHSWHPVPFLLYSRYCRPVKIKKFGETECGSNGMGRIQAAQLMSLAMAHALKLNKFGA
ncbi:MAG: 2,3-bisphosphoglycerate-independent phosphoglycerate mutase [Dehalococcoidales bacterium]|nr:2,3-bisphosphoglycerate-independent phosphoglycerate mutase [Dehalococcoidales bacterium]